MIGNYDCWFVLEIFLILVSKFKNLVYEIFSKIKTNVYWTSRLRSFARLKTVPANAHVQHAGLLSQWNLSNLIGLGCPHKIHRVHKVISNDFPRNYISHKRNALFWTDYIIEYYHSFLSDEIIKILIINKFLYFGSQHLFWKYT